MRLAAIDIGTNSVHMIVVRVRPDFSFEVVDREKEMVRLGAGRARRAQAHARRPGGRAAGALEVRTHRPVAPGRRDPGGRDQRDARGRERRRLPRRHRAADRHPRPHHHRDRRGSPHSPRGRLRRGHAERSGGDRHRRRQRRNHARQRPGGEVRAQLQDRRHPAHRALRLVRPDHPARRAQDAEVHRRAGRPLHRPRGQGGLRSADWHFRHHPLAGDRGHGDRPRARCRRRCGTCASARRA